MERAQGSGSGESLPIAHDEQVSDILREYRSFIPTADASRSRRPLNILTSSKRTFDPPTTLDVSLVYDYRDSLEEFKSYVRELERLRAKSFSLKLCSVQAHGQFLEGCYTTEIDLPSRFELSSEAKKLIEQLKSTVEGSPLQREEAGSLFLRQ